MMFSQFLAIVMLSHLALNPPANKQELRIQKACEGLEQQHVDRLCKMARAMAMESLTRGKIVRKLRESLNVEGDWRKCISEISQLKTVIEEAVAAEALRSLKASLTERDNEWVRYAYAQRLKKIAKVKQQLQYWRDFKPIRYPPGSFRPGSVIYDPNSVDRPKKIAGLERELGALEANDPTFIPAIPRDNLEVGVIGSFSGNLRVVRVVGGSEVVAEFVYWHYKYNDWVPAERVWLAGIPTSQFVDGEFFQPNGIFKITGTRSGGYETMYLAEPFEVNPDKLARLIP